jgi:hypothetical protein
MVTVRRVRVLKNRSDDKLDNLLKSLTAEQKKMAEESEPKPEQRVQSIIDEIFTKHSIPSDEPEKPIEARKRPADSIQALINQLNAEHKEE